MSRTVEHVADAMRDGFNRKEPATVLIGAGCSKTAGIPLASELVDEVRRRHPRMFADAPDKSYPQVMSHLDTGFRYQLIGEFVDRARLNWAHILLAWLIKQKYVGRILTTNFDNLLLRACALFGVSPAVYDLATGTALHVGLVKDPAIFFLHGQYRGFVQFHKPEEVEANAKRLKPLFIEHDPRTWLVIGYSGECDPVFENLVHSAEFPFALHWVGYGENNPNDVVRERLLSPGRQAYVVPDYDADRFFVELVLALGLEFPIKDPFGHMLALLEGVMPLPLSSTSADFTSTARGWLKTAQVEILLGDHSGARDRDLDALHANLQQLMDAGSYDEVIAMAEADGALPTQLNSLVALSAQVAWAYSERAQRTGSPADYERALALSPAPHELLVRWGALAMSRAVLDGADRARQLARAQACFEGALALRENFPPALYNLATLAATNGSPRHAVSWLERRQHALPDLTAAVLREDPSFGAMLSAPEFHQFLESIDERIGSTAN